MDVDELGECHAKERVKRLLSLTLSDVEDTDIMDITLREKISSFEDTWGRIKYIESLVVFHWSSILAYTFPREDELVLMLTICEYQSDVGDGLLVVQCDHQATDQLKLLSLEFPGEGLRKLYERYKRLKYEHTNELIKAPMHTVMYDVSDDAIYQENSFVRNPRTFSVRGIFVPEISNLSDMEVRPCVTCAIYGEHVE